MLPLELPSQAESPILPVESASDRPTLTSPEQAAPPDRSPNWSFFGVFGSTFITIFLAELGDKTQLATLLMAAESHNPGVVFAGAASALVATSLVGVLIGQWLCTRLTPKTLETTTGIILLSISIGLMIDIVRP